MVRHFTVIEQWRSLSSPSGTLRAEATFSRYKLACEKQLLFARQLIPRKCNLCSQSSRRVMCVRTCYQYQIEGFKPMRQVSMASLRTIFSASSPSWYSYSLITLTRKVTLYYCYLQNVLSVQDGEGLVGERCLVATGAYELELNFKRNA